MADMASRHRSELLLGTEPTSSVLIPQAWCQDESGNSGLNHFKKQNSCDHMIRYDIINNDNESHFSKIHQKMHVEINPSLSVRTSVRETPDSQPLLRDLFRPPYAEKPAAKALRRTLSDFFHQSRKWWSFKPATRWERFRDNADPDYLPSGNYVNIAIEHHHF